MRVRAPEASEARVRKSRRVKLEFMAVAGAMENGKGKIEKREAHGT